LRKETILNALRFALGINSGKKFFICFSEKSADFSEKLLHGWGCKGKRQLQRSFLSETVAL